jgi:hypothetical protein
MGLIIRHVLLRVARRTKEVETRTGSSSSVAIVPSDQGRKSRQTAAKGLFIKRQIRVITPEAVSSERGGSPKQKMRNENQIAFVWERPIHYGTLSQSAINRYFL